MKDPNISINNIFTGTTPILLRKNAPIAFQKIPTVKKVRLIARRKSISKVLINKMVTRSPVPDDIEPLRIPIKKISITNLNFIRKITFLFTEFKPKLGLRNEYMAKKIEIKPNIKYRYCSDIYFTIDEPKITPGIPKNSICNEI